MNFNKLTKSNKLDLYKDFYNLLDENEKRETFYGVTDNEHCDPILISDMEKMTPDEFFELYYLSAGDSKGQNLEILELISMLQSNRIIDALINLEKKDIFASFEQKYKKKTINNIDLDTIDISIFNSKGDIIKKFNSVNDVFDECITIEDFEQSIYIMAILIK